MGRDSVKLYLLFLLHRMDCQAFCVSYGTQLSSRMSL